MYRACTLRALRDGVDLSDPAALAETVERARVELVPNAEGTQVLLDGEDVSAAIRTPEVTRAIHHLANCPEVRERLVAQQRALARASERSVVAEGRDLASVVFPDAEVKVYLDASVEERARRRQRDLGPAAPPFDELLAEIRARDERDRSRSVGPLVRVPEAVAVDTSSLSPAEVLERLHALATAAQNRCARET